MSSTDNPSTTAPEPRRSWLRRIFRIGFPQVVLGAWSIVIVALATWPVGFIEEQYRPMGMYMISMIVGMILGYWFLFGVQVRASRKVVVFACVLGFPAAFCHWPDFDGNMWPASLRTRLGFTLLFSPLRIEANRTPMTLLGPRTEGINLQRSEAEPNNDWPEFRGPFRDGVVRRGPALNRDWRARPPRVVWKKPIDPGYSSFAVVNGYLFTLQQSGANFELETLACYRADTGEPVWTHSWPAKFEEKLGGIGPRSTPTVHEGRVYALGATGILVCVDGATGKPIWQVDTLAGNDNLMWGMSGSPLVVDDKVIVNPGTQKPEKKGQAVQAFDRLTGKRIWANGSARAGYSSPMTVTAAGVKQILLFDGEGVAGLDIASGNTLWRYPWATNQWINVMQPLLLDERRLFIASGYQVGGAVLEVNREGDKWSVAQVGRTAKNTMRAKFASPVEYQGHIYGLNDGFLQCLRLADLKATWSDDRRPRIGSGGYGHGQLVRWENLLIVLTEFGELALVEAAPDAFRELGRLPVLRGDKTWNNFAVVDGFAYIRNSHEMACVDLR